MHLKKKFLALYILFQSLELTASDIPNLLLDGLLVFCVYAFLEVF